VFKGTVTVSTVYNYLKVIALKSPWFEHMAPDVNIFLTVSLICNERVKFLCLGSKIIQNYHFNALRAAQSAS
jgi:hypothetical protein